MRTLITVFFFFAVLVSSCRQRTERFPPVKFKENEYRVITKGFSSASYNFYVYVKDCRLNSDHSTLLEIIDCLLTENMDEVIKHHSRYSFLIFNKNFDGFDDITDRWALEVYGNVSQGENFIRKIKSTIEPQVEKKDFGKRKIECKN